MRANSPEQEQREYVPATFTFQYNPACIHVTTSKILERVEENQPHESQDQIMNK